MAQHELRAARIAAGGAVVAAVISAIAVLIGALINNSLNESKDVQNQVADAVNEVRRQLPAADLSDVRSTDVISADIPMDGELTGTTLNVRGTLNQPLPSGVTIRVASKVGNRYQPGVANEGTIGIDAGGPCDVDTDNMTFDCGDVYVGDPKDEARYDIFIGLANSSQARQMVAMINQQVCSRPVPQPAAPDGTAMTLCTQDYDNPAPGGVKWLPPIRRTRE